MPPSPLWPAFPAPYTILLQSLGREPRCCPLKAGSPEWSSLGSGEGLRGNLSPPFSVQPGLPPRIILPWLTSWESPTPNSSQGPVYNHIQGTRREDICPSYAPSPPKTSQTSWRLNLAFLPCGLAKAPSSVPPWAIQLLWSLSPNLQGWETCCEAAAHPAVRETPANLSCEPREGPPQASSYQVTGGRGK